MIVKANPAGILGTGHCVPEQVWTNEYLETFRIEAPNKIY